MVSPWLFSIIYLYIYIYNHYFMVSPWFPHGETPWFHHEKCLRLFHHGLSRCHGQHQAGLNGHGELLEQRLAAEAGHHAARFAAANQGGRAR